ncbi:acyltransferase family protein [Cystobacter ferrugineus]|nr:acyltransferase [Cystobacter ferrugineus]
MNEPQRLRRSEPEAHLAPASSPPPEDSSQAISAPRRIKSIDVLRGVAVLMVLLNHLEPVTVPGLPEPSGPWGFVYWKVKQFGWTGVDLFFVLSGFLISGLLFSELRKHNTLDCVSFWLRRGFKIWPSYLVLLLVLGVTGATGYIQGSTWDTKLTSLLAHLLFFQNYLDKNPNGPTWSLAVEEHFYLILPVLLLGLTVWTRRRSDDWGRWMGRVTWVFLTGCLAARLARVATGLRPDDFMQTHFRLDSLMVGVYCQYLWLYRRSTVDKLLAWPKASLCLSLLLLSPALVLSRGQAAMFTFGFLGLSVAYAILLFLLVGGVFSRLERTFPATCLARIGTWSYNIYLWHFFMASLNLAFFTGLNRALAEGVAHQGLRFVLQTLIYVGYAIAVGAIATRWIEMPFLRLRERFFPPRLAPRT